MNKVFKIITAISLMGLFCISCSNNNPRSRGIEAGKKACECYKLDGFKAVDSCLNVIEQENTEFQDDTAYTNAMEEQMIRCATEGVIDIVKPIE